MNFAGDRDVLIELLKEPAKARQIRKLKEEHVERIKQDMLKNPNSSFTILAVNITDVSKEDYQEELLHTYNLEVIGGNHTRAAQVFMFSNGDAENKDNYKFSRVRLYCKLNNEEANYIGLTHNETMKLVLHESLPDRLKLYRQQLMMSGDMGVNLDQDPPKNHKILQKWKESLIQILGLENVSIFAFYIYFSTSNIDFHSLTMDFLGSYNFAV